MNRFTKITLCGLFIALTLFSGCKFNPDNIKAYIITYVTDKGETPDQIALAEGAKLKRKHLPEIETNYFKLDGWYYNGKKVKPGFEVKENLTLTAKWNLTGYEYVVTDTTDLEVNPSGNSTFSKDGNYTKATVTKNGSISNWVLSYNDNRTKPAYGFEAKIKCNDKIGWAGIQWFTGASGYDCYYFEVGGDGSFKIQSHIGDQWATILHLKSNESTIVKNDYNTIQLKGLKMSDFEVYVNGSKVCTIKQDELKITPGFLALAATGSKNCSSSNPGYAWLKLMSVQQVK